MRRAAIVLGLALTLVAGSALAGEADAGVGEAETLVAHIDADVMRAQSDDCAIACDALQSMMRASDRLCSIEPEARCRAAREKVKGAIERVRSSCPECSALAIGAAEEARPQPVSPPENATTVQAAPGRHGGCAGCATASTEDGERSWLGFAVFAALIALRRRLKGKKR